MNANLVAVATIGNGATTLYADVSGGLSPASAIIVQTSAPVALLHPAGWPSRPSLQGLKDYPQTIPSGSTVTLLAPEALAWIAAGVAVQTGAT